MAYLVSQHGHTFKMCFKSIKSNAFYHRHGYEMGENVESSSKMAAYTELYVYTLKWFYLESKEHMIYWHVQDDGWGSSGEFPFCSSTSQK